MLKRLEKSLKETPFVRRWRRRFGRSRNRLLGKPDAWADLLQIIRRTQPAAILDIGSYIGRTVQRFADEIRDIPIHSFEPTPGSAATLRRNVARYRNVQVHELAISDAQGTRNFSVNRAHETNSLLNGAVTDISGIAPQFIQHVANIQVQTTTLDHWCREHVTHGELIVKADVQGAEGLLLAGAAEVFSAKRVTAFYCEIAFADLYEGQASFAQLHAALTQQHGMSLWQIYKLSRASNGAACWGDALWVNANGLAALV
jgi:FkbM family methyltransferase